MLVQLLLVACPALMPAAVSTDPVAPPTSDAESAELVNATYDLSVLHGPDRERHLHVPLLPGLTADRHDESDDHDTVLAEVVESMLVDVLHEEEMQYAGREIGRWGDGTLELTAPQAVHDDTRRLIDYLSQASGRQATLRFDRFEVTDPAVLVSADDLDGLVEQGLLIPAGSRREIVALGVTERRGGLRSVQFVRGWETEIAQSTATFQPDLESWDVGTQLLVHVAPSGVDRYGVSVMESRDDLLDIESRVVGLPAVAVSEAGTLPRLFSDVRYDLPQVDTCRLTASGVLQEGGALVVGAVTETIGGLRGVLTRVVLESVTTEPTALRLDQGTLRVVDVSRALWFGVRAGDLDSQTFLGDGPDQQSPEGYTHMDIPELSFPGEGVDWDRSVYPRLSDFQDQGGSLWNEGGLAVLWAGNDAVDAAARALARALSPAPGGVFTWGLEAADGRQVAAGRLPLEAGSDAFTLVGEARGLLHGTDVDVATRTFAHQARSIVVLDGLGLRVRLRGDRAQIQLARSALVDLERQDLARDLIGMFDFAPADRIDLNVSVSADGRRHDLGRVDSGDDPLTLWARLDLSPGGR